MSILGVTENLIIRELTPNDENNLYNLDNDPLVMKYITNGKTTSKSLIKEHLNKMLSLYKKYDHRLGFWAIIHKETQEFIGWFHFRPGRKDSENITKIELGYRLKQKFWNQGYATEGSLFFLTYGFETLKVQQVFAITMKDNLASQAVMKKIGMSFDCEFVDHVNFPNTEIISVQYAIRRSQWIASIRNS